MNDVFKRCPVERQKYLSHLPDDCRPTVSARNGKPNKYRLFLHRFIIIIIIIIILIFLMP